MDRLKRYVNDDRFRVVGDKNMRLLAFAFTIVFVWTGPKSLQLWVVAYGWFDCILNEDVRKRLCNWVSKAIKLR